VVVAEVGGQFSEGLGIGLAPVAPGIFTRNQAGSGEAIVFHQDGVSPVTAQNPAKRNEVVTIHATGFGVLNPALGTGVPAGANLAQAQVTIAFGSANATIEYAGAAPGLVGVNQINARIPAGAPIANDVPIALNVGGRQANSVTVAIGQ
jgi:uncharacterized protein (TIGR03437 family)